MKISCGPILKSLLWIFIGGYAFVNATGLLRAGDSTVRISGPLVPSANSNYFQDANGQALILNGSQTWNTFQDWGSKGTLEPLDFDAFVTFLSAHGTISPCCGLLKCRNSAVFQAQRVLRQI